jgi:glycosyltransferase involved in cell wall biosynthesis
MVGQVMNDFDDYLFQQPPWVYERTVVLDYIDEQTRKDALDCCDVLVMHARADCCGSAHLEAWCYKKPVIGTYVGGIPGVIAEGKDGFLVPYGDVHMLSEYIELLLAHPAMAEAMGANGYSKVLKNHTREAGSEELLALYHQVLK